MSINPQLERPKQPLPDEIVGRLLALVRAQFCGDMPGAEWGKHSHFILRNVIMWPAHFICNVKGFTLPAERYEAIMREVFSGIKRHGLTGEIRYWPAYLMKCVQDHWRHHWEAYYAEAKSVRNIAETALASLGKVPQREDRTVEALALAHRALEAAKRGRKTRPGSKQLPLFGN